MEKTIEQWFQELPEPYRTKALENCTSPIDNEMVGSMMDALASGFLWQDTPEGEAYWDDVFLTIQANEFDDNHHEEQQYEAEQEDNANRTEFTD